jgi:hypothetical protein
MASPTRIAELAALTQKNTNIVDEYLTGNGLPTPSFDESSPPAVNLAKNIAEVRDAILEVTHELQWLLLMRPAAALYHEVANVGRFLLHPVHTKSSSTRPDHPLSTRSLPSLSLPPP